MKREIEQLACATTLIVLGGLMVQIDAQRRPPGQTDAVQEIETSLRVGTQTYQSNAPGRCTHAPTAAIYQVVSQLWSVQQSSQGRSLTLTVWKPKDGSADMISLSVSNGNVSHDVTTVRGGAATSGAGKITIEKSGAGGTLTVDAKTSAGTAIAGTIKCNAFAPHTAEGGL